MAEILVRRGVGVMNIPREDWTFIQRRLRESPCSSA
jgi:hypothetical protein